MDAYYYMGLSLLHYLPKISKFTVASSLIVPKIPHVKFFMLDAWSSILVLVVKVDVASNKLRSTLSGAALVIVISIPGGDDNVIGKVSLSVCKYEAMLLSLMNHLRADRFSMVHVNCTTVGQSSPSN